MPYSLLDHIKKFIEIISSIVPSICFACETDIVLKLKILSDVPAHLVQGEELSEAEELVERALDVTLNPKMSIKALRRLAQIMQEEA